MYAAELVPDTTTTTTRTPVDTATDRGTAAVYRQAPDRADVIDAWARHVAASNGFGEATTGDTPATYVLPYWKSR